MNEGIVGKWIPFARQAIFDETPMRALGKDDFATLTLEPNGKGYSRRETLFGNQKADLQWQRNEDGLYEILVEDAGLLLIADVLGDELRAVVAAPELTGVYRMGIYFNRG